MPTHICIGFSRDPEPEKAFNLAAISLKNQINQPALDLLIILLTPAYAKQELLLPLHRILNPRRTIGAVTPAILVNGQSESRGVAMLGIASDEIRIGAAATEHVSFSPARETAFNTARAAESDLSVNQRYGSLFFLNSSAKNNAKIITGLQDGLGHSFAITGAITCDNNLRDAPIIFDDKILTDAFAGFVWGGQTSAAVTARHGWRALGKPRMITSAEDNLIHLIDNKPAVTIYENYFKDELSRSTSAHNSRLRELTLLYPLGIHTENPREYSIHHVVEILADGTLVCQAEIPAGAYIHLMIGDKDACRQAVRDATIELRDQLNDRPPKIIFVIESIARRKLFGRASSLDQNIIKDILGLTVPILGMYTYGEIAPLGQLKKIPNTQPQSTSIVLTAIG